MKTLALAIVTMTITGLATATPTEMETVATVSQCYRDVEVLKARVAELEAKVAETEEAKTIGPEPVIEQEPEPTITAPAGFGR